MKTIVTRMDLVRTKATWADSVFAPAFIINRPTNDATKWLVADSAISELDGISWATTDHDEFIRVPLFEYRLPPQGDLALAFMFKRGLIAAAAAPFLVEQLRVITGNPAELEYDAAGNLSAMVYWFGFAVSPEV